MLVLGECMPSMIPTFYVVERCGCYLPTLPSESWDPTIWKLGSQPFIHKLFYSLQPTPKENINFSYPQSSASILMIPNINWRNSNRRNICSKVPSLLLFEWCIKVSLQVLSYTVYTKFAKLRSNEKNRIFPDFFWGSQDSTKNHQNHFLTKLNIKKTSHISQSQPAISFSNLVRLIFIQRVIKNSTVHSDPGNHRCKNRRGTSTPPWLQFFHFSFPIYGKLGECHLSTLLGEHLPINRYVFKCFYCINLTERSIVCTVIWTTTLQDEKEFPCTAVNIVRIFPDF